MNIRKIITTALFAATLVWVGSCSTDSETEYVGGDLIGFADTALYCPVYEDPDSSYDLGIAATRAVSYDRNFAVEVVAANSSAIEGVHYTLPSYNFTIPAGQTKSSVEVKGIWENFAPTDSVGLQLRLIVPDNYISELNPETQDVEISFVKVCDFDINQFEGYAILSSMFLYEQFYDWYRLVKVEVDPDAENTVIIRNPFSASDIYRDNYDLTIRFNTEDPLSPALEIDGGQIIYSVRNIFEYILGDGWLRAQQSVSYTSFYNMCQKYALFYVDIYAEGDGGGTLGSGYLNVLEWISDEEAEIILREGFDYF